MGGGQYSESENGSLSRLIMGKDQFSNKKKQTIFPFPWRRKAILFGIVTHSKPICILRKYIIHVFNSIVIILYYAVGQNPLVRICEIQSIMGNNSSTLRGELGCLHDVNTTADLRQSSIRFHLRRGIYEGPSPNFASNIKRIQANQ